MYVARDPTSRQSVVLPLLALDDQTSVFLGRPCYHRSGEKRPVNCTSSLWTGARYSEAVVVSMTQGVAVLVEQAGAKNVTLIGYSGGGVLALLVAQRVPSISTVVTLGANLDIHAWTQHHRLLPLTGSINPSDIVRWRSDLRQIHYIGGRDRRVPPETRTAFVERVPQATFITLPELDHYCCWQDRWLEILKSLDGISDS